MSQEIYQIMLEISAEDFEMQMVAQCAPVIAGIKISNLLIIPYDNECMLESFVKGTYLQFFRLMQNGKKTTYIIFNRKSFEEYLSSPEVIRFLKSYGYQNIRIGEMLVEFQKRYKKNIGTPEQFPHEMGIILGYPVEDVIGFTKNKGKDFLYSGYWKVYEDMNAKVELFKRFENAMNEQIKMMASGLSLSEIVTYYLNTESILLCS